ncbi:MAG: hypothetical protein DMF60_13450 [Acidobacteria bacterium]|nr:MAG: hypothetical protein DMF60_13450 [Acidobacteriota bacterium]
MPECAAVLAARVFQKLHVEFGWVPAQPRLFSIKAQIIRMHVEERHATVLSHPVQFPEPDPRVIMAEQQKNGGILGERIGQLCVAKTRRALRKLRAES